MEMDKRTLIPILCTFLCWVLDSSKGEKIHTTSSISSRSEEKDGLAVGKYTEEQLSKAELQGYLPCPECYKKRTRFPTSIAEKIRASKASSSRENKSTPRNRVFPKESENIVFSRKYNPDLRSANDGFVPVAGPYGTKTRLAREGPSKAPSSSSGYQSGSEARYANGVPKHGKNHIPRHSQNIIIPPQNVQRRSQYRSPKVHEDLSVKESIIAGENLLGNGNFEIIRGGIYSDQDANEILGSRRISRGYGSYVMPTYRQSRYRSTQNVHFPSYYQRRNQNPVHPMFFQRASY